MLILGSMPSAASLAAGQYYAHPRNAFWPIMSALLNEGDSSGGGVDWVERRKMLTKHHVALWDVAQACVREGSADASIRDAEPNRISGLLEACPDIRAICMNGRKAAEMFRSMVEPGLTDAQRAIPRVTLPSTSPARALRFEVKLAAWQIVGSFLETK